MPRNPYKSISKCKQRINARKIKRNRRAASKRKEPYIVEITMQYLKAKALLEDKTWEP